VCFSGAFRLYDVDNDGYITRDEMYNIVDAIYQMVVCVAVTQALQSAFCGVRAVARGSLHVAPTLSDQSKAATRTKSAVAFLGEPQPHSHESF
jgi:hypothetical protein